MAEESRSKVSLLTKMKLAGLGFVAVVLLILVLQNTESVAIKLLFFTFTVPQTVLLFGTTIAGFLLGIVTANRLFK